MGTRNLVAVMFNGEYKVSQYSQWDGYPAGQGTTILNFLNILDGNYEKFKEQLNKCKFVDSEKQKEIEDFLHTIGSRDGWLNQSQSSLYNQKYPYFSRDHGGEILQLILFSKDETIWLEDSLSFVQDGLFCEWAYVIDLDKGTFEVYEGYGQEGLDKSERFYQEKPNEGGYYPVRLVKSYNLYELPSEEEFLNNFKDESE